MGMPGGHCTGISSDCRKKTLQLPSADTKYRLSWGHFFFVLLYSSVRLRLPHTRHKCRHDQVVNSYSYGLIMLLLQVSKYVCMYVSMYVLRPFCWFPDPFASIAKLLNCFWLAFANESCLYTYATNWTHIYNIYGTYLMTMGTAWKLCKGSHSTCYITHGQFSFSLASSCDIQGSSARVWYLFTVCR